MLLLLFFNILYGSDIIQKNAKYLSNHEFKDLQKLNKFNGDVTESVMSNYFKNSGWGELNGEVGVNGIDGLFVKKDKVGRIKDIMIVESKYNKSQLGYIDKRTPNLKSKQMSKRALKKQVDNLIVDTRKKMSKVGSMKDKTRLKKQLSDYKAIKSKIHANDYRTRLFKIKPVGDNKFKITIDALEKKGYKDVVKTTLKGSKKYKAHNVIIDIKKSYKKGSYQYKLQSQLKKSIKTTKASHKIKRAYNSSTKTSKMIKSAIPTVFLKKGNKVMTFIDGDLLKSSSKFKKLKFLNNLKRGDVVMMVIENGLVAYSIMKGGISYKKVSALLMTNTRMLAREGFTKGIAFLTPPPATLLVFATIAGGILFDYAIDKYIELDKRSYVSLEDMLWDVPDEIKNKITVLNLEDIKNDTILDFSEIDNETILENRSDNDGILNVEASNRDTIFD